MAYIYIYIYISLGPGKMSHLAPQAQERLSILTFNKEKKILIICATAQILLCLHLNELIFVYCVKVYIIVL